MRAALTRGEDVNSKDVGGGTPLRWAVVNKENSIVRLLLEQPALDLNLADYFGKTALHHAVSEDNVEGVRLLLADPRLNPNQKDNSGRAPVMKAMFDRNVDTLRELVAHPSVDLDTRDSRGRSLEERARIRWELNNFNSMRILILFVAWSVDLPRRRGLLLRLVREEEWKRRGSKWQITRFNLIELISSFLPALNFF